MKRALLLLFAALLAPAVGQAQMGDSLRGAQALDRLGCASCHAIRGVGGNGAPDLGVADSEDFSPTDFAASMWNHTPRMWGVMESIPAPGDQELRDLWAFFYSVRWFEPSGDRNAGRRVFQEKQCYRCHALIETESIGPPVPDWPLRSDPIAYLESMWNHGDQMGEEMSAQGIRRPEFTAEEMADLVAYIDNLPELPPGPGRIRAGDPDAGMKIFADLDCSRCHSVLDYDNPADVIPLTPRPGRHRTLTDLAAEMWNHRPIMEEWARETGLRVDKFEPGQMGDLLSYLFEEGFLEFRGDPDRGEGLFSSKSCAVCHGPTGDDLPHREYLAADIVAGMWRHGPEARDKLREENLPWPTLSAADMADILTYLNAR